MALGSPAKVVTSHTNTLRRIEDAIIGFLKGHPSFAYADNVGGVYAVSLQADAISNDIEIDVTALAEYLMREGVA